MDDNDILIDKIEPIEGFYNQQEKYYKSTKTLKRKVSKQTYKDLFSKHFKKDLSNFDINAVIKDGKRVFSIYSKKYNKEFFQDYDCLCELLNFCEHKENLTGVNLDIKI
ncbi:MAG: hypothetical protein ACPLXO_01425 [Desulfurella sp.]|uniref:hypothetical protein n=1 Tax=Desulfurella sp. TaxID=1962857 RepID=UPI003CA57782